MDYETARFSRAEVGCHQAVIFIDIAEKRPAFFSMKQQFAKRQARLYDL
jgi:hypothetical protein